MPPPARKKRKTEGARRTTRSQRPSLSTELIGKVASFANYGDDLMNICKAVGRKESAAIRHTCLRNNMEYLRYTLEDFTAKLQSPSQLVAWLKLLRNFAAWMKVNTDWRKHCALERTEDEELATCTVQRESDEDGQRVVNLLSANPLIVFNNPAVAAELGFTIILKHLVEEVGIDINANAWCSYTSASVDDEPTKTHLLAAALTYAETDRTSFDYLLSREETNVHLPVPISTSRNRHLWDLTFEASACSCRNFRAFVKHSSFDPNQYDGFRTISNLPILVAFTSCIATAEFIASRSTASTSQEEKIARSWMDVKFEKFKILLEVGADPELDLGVDINVGILDIVRHFLANSGGSGVRTGNQMIAMMEEKIASR